MRNKPYVKVYEHGLLMNPITKDQPYEQAPSQKIKRQRKSNNRKGEGLVVTRIGLLNFIKYRIVKQHIKGGLIVNALLKE
jgi:hypothetical protein